MLGLEYIKQQNDIAVERAAAQNLTPYLPFDSAEVLNWRESAGFPFPELGDYTPAGYERVDSLFCDSSGLGQFDEPALTVDQLCDYIAEHLGENLSYALGDVGQFQLYVNVFRSLE